MKKILFTILYSLCTLNPISAENLVNNGKKAIIIIGPASSGSTFITNVISHVLNEPRTMGFTPQIDKNKDVIINHLSLPAKLPLTSYGDLNYFKQHFKGYDLLFVITTRDVEIQSISQTMRWGHNKNNKCNPKIMSTRSQKILSEIMETEEFFIWSYETQIYLREAYFKQLYKFLKVKSDYFPPHLSNENVKYIKY